MERVSLVMGGATPIGRAVADRLVDEGHLVAILDGDPDGVARMEAEFDPDITLAFAVDVTDPEDMAEVVDAIAERFGPPTGLVLVAPAFPSTPFLESGTEAINAMLEQHVFGAMALVLLTAERMEAGGSIVTVLPPPASGPAGPRVLAETARDALCGFTRSAAAELARAGIRVNAVHAPAPDASTGGSSLRRALARGRTLDPDGGETAGDVAGSVMFLMSDEAGQVTGQVLAVGRAG